MNHSSLFQLEKHDKQRIYGILVPVIVVLYLTTIALNIYVLLSLSWLKASLSPTLKLTFSLLVSDAWTSAVVATGLLMNSYIPYVIGSQFTSACVPLAFEAFRVGGILTAVLHLLVVSVNHYLSIALPFRYNSIMTPMITALLIGFMWFAPPLAMLLHFSVRPGLGFQSFNCEAHEQLYYVFRFRVVIAALFFGMLLIMTLVYLHIWLILTRMDMSLRRGSLSSGNAMQLKKRKNTVMTAVLIVLTFLFGWIPTSLLFVLFCNDCLFRRDSVDTVATVTANLIMVHFCIAFKTLINPIIYAVRIPEIKGALQHMNCGRVLL